MIEYAPTNSMLTRLAPNSKPNDAADGIVHKDRQMSRTPVRARDLGMLWQGECGPWNAIKDVPCVAVGTATIAEAEPRPGRRLLVLTGVTAIVQSAEPARLRADFHRFNGNGEMTGMHWIADSGMMTGPIFLTKTHSVRRVHQAAIAG